MQVKLIAVTQPLIPGVENVEQLMAYCARVSNPNNQANHDTAPKLMAYLVKNEHWSPFEMGSVVMEIVTTRDIARQILRHRSFSFQEFSQRYAEVQAEPVVRETRLQDTKNRQNSIETENSDLQIWWEHAQGKVNELAQEAYTKALQKGIAKEVARAVLPEGTTESRLYMSGTIRSWIHYVNLRSSPGTQKEHRAIAQACRSIIINAIPSLSEVLAGD
jgi:thymidylate synthase (FAD)